MSSTQFWVGLLVPPLIKWANPKIKRVFKLQEFDILTQERVTTKQYPTYYGVLYGLWGYSHTGKRGGNAAFYDDLWLNFIPWEKFCSPYVCGFDKYDRSLVYLWSLAGYFVLANIPGKL